MTDEAKIEEDEMVDDVTEPDLADELADAKYNERLEAYKALLERRTREKEEVMVKVKERYKGIKMYSITLPYNGTFVIKAQEMSDTRLISEATEKFMEDEFAKHGGREAIEKMPDTEKNRIFNYIDSKATDISNDLLLKRCVLYPFNIKEMMDSEEPGKNIPIGAASILLERIVDVSGWQDVIAEEV